MLRKKPFIAPSERKRREREKQRVMIQEKLQERKKRWEREVEQQKAEQSQLEAEQEKSIKQVLNSQAGLAEEYVQLLKCLYKKSNSVRRKK